LLITNIDYSDYVGRIGIGRVSNGSVRHGEWVSICKANSEVEKIKVTQLYVYDGLKHVEVKEASPETLWRWQAAMTSPLATPSLTQSIPIPCLH
jgi:predicted membrane GTPase involved in stress response